jgi:CBS-domain-containing membrane protein
LAKTLGAFRPDFADIKLRIEMQRRLIASIAGGVLGMCLARPLEDALGVSATLAFLAAPLGGIALAYVGSLLFDVFAGVAPPGSAPE